MQNKMKKLSIEQQYNLFSRICIINDALKNWVYDRMKANATEEAAFNAVSKLNTNECVKFANRYAENLNFNATAPDKILRLNKLFDKMCLALQDNNQVLKQDFSEFSTLSDELTVELHNFMDGRFSGDFVKHVSKKVGDTDEK